MVHLLMLQKNKRKGEFRFHILPEMQNTTGTIETTDLIEPVGERIHRS